MLRTCTVDGVTVRKSIIFREVASPSTVHKLVLLSLLRYRALKYVDGTNAEENEGYFADGENDPSSTPLNRSDILKLIT